PWKKSAIAKRFERSAEKIGIQTLKDQGIAIPPLPRFNRRDYKDKVELAAARKAHQKKISERRKEILKLARKHSTRFAAYDLRHGFATRKLVQGVDALTVAELMGHRDGTMLAKVYQHLDRNHDHLKKAPED